MADETSKRGLGSEKMSEEEKRRIQSMGGKASGASGAAGKTEAAKRGGENSHSDGRKSGE